MYMYMYGTCACACMYMHIVHTCDEPEVIFNFLALLTHVAPIGPVLSPLWQLFSIQSLVRVGGGVLKHTEKSEVE